MKNIDFFIGSLYEHYEHYEHLYDSTVLLSDLNCIDLYSDSKKPNDETFLFFWFEYDGAMWVHCCLLENVRAFLQEAESFELKNNRFHPCYKFYDETGTVSLFGDCLVCENGGSSDSDNVPCFVLGTLQCVAPKKDPTNLESPWIHKKCLPAFTQEIREYVNKSGSVADGL